MARTKGRKPGSARRKAEREAAALASSTVTKPAVLKDDTRTSSSKSAAKVATSNNVQKPVVRKKSRKPKKSKKSRLLAALHRLPTVNKHAMVLRSASSIIAEKPAVSDELAASRVVSQTFAWGYGSLSVLSAEILLLIFSELEYSHLKVCTMVNKSFLVLLDHPCFDRSLFRRRTPLVDIKSITPVSIPGFGGYVFPDHEKIWVEVHPSLSMMSYGCSPGIQDPRFYDYSSSAISGKHWPVIETSAAKEYATVPPLRELKIRIYNRPAISIKNKWGVTVRDVLEALVGHFGKIMPGVMIFDLPAWEYRDEGDNTKNRPATYQDAQGDRNGWHGFEGQSMDSDGTLVLVADSFDS